MNYEWSVPEQITVVESTSNWSKVELEDGTSIPKAYIVFGDNKKALENARSWAGDGATEHIIPNTANFTLELLMSAERSSQGGKLSFWNCRIGNTDYNLDVSVGINAEILCLLLRETTFVKGICQENVVFVRKGSELGVVGKDTPTHKLALASQSNKNNISKGKTTKWERGYKYETQNNSDIWIGDGYKPLTIIGQEIWNPEELKFDLSNLRKPLHLLIESNHIQNMHKDDDDTWAHHHIRFAKSFPSRKRIGDKEFDDEWLDKVLNVIINKNLKSIDHDSKAYYYGLSDLENALTSVDGIITDEMIARFKQIASEDAIKCYDEPVRWGVCSSTKRKFIVLLDNTETEFDSIVKTCDFIVQKLQEYTKSSNDK